ncbi:ribonucleases P/MRP protein subunit POP1-domain-containing protein [Mrakia frigida]|uniref:ribonuclease P/MRP protein subunit POP1 n=1 Tax=Mrakia frigida TaxID=29902 RepID=UPI003FCC12A2
MPPLKRPNSTAPSNGKSHKRTKLQQGRQITSKQPSSSSSSSRAQSSPAVGKGNDAALKGMAGLPQSIEVEKFALARSFEIQAMKTAMKSAFDSSTKRAFQTLPRHLRRRAASHNARRVPGRLRAKATQEIDPKTRTAPVKKHYPKLKKSIKTGLSRTDKLRRRQRSKMWLETHIWMAKRMHMVNTWGFRLAHRPTEKAFRPSHRAAMHGSILNDVSYFSLIELKGEEVALERVLRRVAGEVCWGKRFTPGSRLATTTLHLPSAYPLSLLCPATVLWCPPPPPPTSPTLPSTSASTSTNPLPSSSPLQRQIWIRFHPTSHAEVWGALRSSITSVLTEIRDERAAALAKGKGKGKGKQREVVVEGEQEVEIEMSDRREEVNAFEIVGPKSGRVLKGALGGLIKAEERAEMKKIWSELRDLKTSGSLPRGMVMGFKVYDPRLSFPPTNAKPSDPKSDAAQSSAWEHEPSSDLARSELWDAQIRSDVGRNKFKKSELDRRRQEIGIPSTPLRPLVQDSRIPLLLIQHTLSPPSSSSATSMHGFLLLLPSKWSQPFLTSLVFTGTRIGGIRERQSQAFESGAGAFPEDWAGTRASRRWWEEREEGLRERWMKKPPGKRENWGSCGWVGGAGEVVDGKKKEEEEGEMGVGKSPWKPDWKGLVASARRRRRGEKMAGVVETSEEELAINGVCDASTSTSTSSAPNLLTPWLLRLPSLSTTLLPNLLTSTTSPSETLLAEINAHRFKRNLDGLPLDQAEDLFDGALVRVTVKICGRGVASEVGPIYLLEEDPVSREEERRWREGYGGGRKGREVDHDEEAETVLPPPTSMVGFHTSGAFSLSRGKGHGIGTVPLSILLELMRKDLDGGRSKVGRGGWMMGGGGTRGELLNLVKVRGRESRVCRAATLEVLD